jgi:hypothetical protein
VSRVSTAPNAAPNSWATARRNSVSFTRSRIRVSIRVALRAALLDQPKVGAAG